MSNNETLKKLVHLMSSKYDDDAVRALVERDQDAVRAYPGCLLRQAISFGASALTVRAICDARPDSVQEVDFGETALHLACQTGATLDVVHLLHGLCPEGIAAKDNLGRTLLHTACVNETPFEVVKYLVSQRPELLMEKDWGGRTPLALACVVRASFEDLMLFLFEAHPDAAREGDGIDWYPLHLLFFQHAAHASLKVARRLVEIYPEALEKQTSAGATPLHLACSRRQATRRKRQPLFELVKLFIEHGPKALEMQDADARTPLQCAEECKSSEKEIIDVLTHVDSLKTLQDNDPQAIQMLRRFTVMGWAGGVALLLNTCPGVVNKIDETLMPNVFSFVGRHCALDTFYSILQDNPVLVKRAVKTGNGKKAGVQPPTKKARN